MQLNVVYFSSRSPDLSLAGQMYFSCVHHCVRVNSVAEPPHGECTVSSDYNFIVSLWVQFA